MLGLAVRRRAHVEHHEGTAVSTRQGGGDAGSIHALSLAELDDRAEQRGARVPTRHHPAGTSFRDQAHAHANGRIVETLGGGCTRGHRNHVGGVHDLDVVGTVEVGTNRRFIPNEKHGVALAMCRDGAPYDRFRRIVAAHGIYGHVRASRCARRAHSAANSALPFARPWRPR